MAQDVGLVGSDRDTLNELLVIELDELGVHFLRRAGAASALPAAQSQSSMPSGPSTPARLLTLLASSQEARLRLAIIPLLFHRPDFAEHLGDAMPLAAPARLTLKCYATAAFYLQRKCRARLARLGESRARLPDLFSADLGLTMCSDPDAGLSRLARRHAELSGKPINWLGTYERAARQWVAILERRQRWVA
ncbi:MAG: hypothetical protein JXM73_22200 [Anaerolineae bacterium]|nr:hypothetical protein [Anaerolineae bacterium]